jgi:hypothetical protein
MHYGVGFEKIEEWSKLSKIGWLYTKTEL